MFWRGTVSFWRYSLDLNRCLVDFLRMRFFANFMCLRSSVAGCGSGETPATAPPIEPAAETNTPAAAPAPTPAPEPVAQTEPPAPAVEPVEPVVPVSPPSAEPTVDVGTAPAEEEPVAVAPATVEPADPTEPKIKLSEDLAAPKPPPVEPRSTAAIRSALGSGSWRKTY